MDPDMVLIIACVPLGLVAGGFVTMLVDRVPDATPFTLRSRCPQCEHELRWPDVAPVVSWFLLRRRCRHCHQAITVAYPIVEVVTAGLFVLVAIRFGAEWVVVPPLLLVTALMALSVIDLYVYRLPDRVLFPALGLSLIAIVAVALAIDRPSSISRALVGMLGYSLFLFVAHMIQPRGMGFGDVKLALLLGLHLGWIAGITAIGWSPVVRLVLYAVLLGFGIGIVVGLALAIVRRVLDRDLAPDPAAVEGQPTSLLKHTFPFGPALAAGAMVAVLWPETFLGV